LQFVAQLDQLGAQPVIIAFDWGEPPRFPTHRRRLKRLWAASQ
jgi:hypothetical protein